MLKFQPRKSIINYYINQLIPISKEVKYIFDEYYTPTDPLSVEDLTRALKKYSEKLNDFASTLVDKIILELWNNNTAQWLSVSQAISRRLDREYSSKNPIFKLARKLHTEQVDLIKTLPLRAAERAQMWAERGRIKGYRFEEVADQIMQSSSLVRYQADRIARTEANKVSTALTKARATSLGINYFRWRTAGDSIVRDSHAHLNNKIFRFDKPPLIPNEGRHLPGDFPNCRCWCEPIIN